MGHGITSLLLVALGGALGGLGRFAISNTMARLLGNAFPWGTLVVNASGALLAGWLLGVYGVPNTQPFWLLAVAGLLGGYTTVSSFSLQTLELWQRGKAMRAALNMIATLLLGVAMAALGWWLAQQV
ncbi:fluoride efflux transporter CrcB [Halomonas sp. BL6]|uniref:fluoride efflux transporter CrcB n=1 Tax=Halomonas sp. BL6 TaxID=2585770 RepID=UPI00111A5194|nr:fluoride efflux transporter CrcB [Halomonas sp. BL6]TNH17665.1 fluoride efflux transporter CrcB [Halomonas sp. BL6]